MYNQNGCSAITLRKRNGSIIINKENSTNKKQHASFPKS